MADLALHPTVGATDRGRCDVSGRGEIVLDGFGGSTLRIREMHAIYCDVARWEAYRLETEGAAAAGQAVATASTVGCHPEAHRFTPGQSAIRAAAQRAPRPKNLPRRLIRWRRSCSTKPRA